MSKAISQIMLILVVLALGNQGFLGQPIEIGQYDNLCSKYVDEKCVQYNPFYSPDLYITEKTLTLWKTISEHDFEPNSLERFMCQSLNYDCDEKTLK